MTNDNTANSNLIDLPQPGTDVVISQDIPSDSSARLNFGPQDIMGLRMGDDGELVITFENGGQLNITNFEDIVDNGNLLYLEDGTLIDPSVLTSSLQSPQDFNSIETAAGAATNSDAITIAQPTANTTQEVALQAGQKYVCDFDPANAALVEVKDGQMVLTFADGSQVVINNFSEVMAGDLPAELTVADGTVIDSTELLTTVTEVEAPSEVELVVAEAEPEPEPVAQQVANIEPAAGENLDAIAESLAEIAPAAGAPDGRPGNTGFGFGSSPTAEPLNSVDAIGPLGPTALGFGQPDANPEQLAILLDPAEPASNPAFEIPTNIVDETNLVNGNLVVTDTVTVDFGADGPAEVDPFCGTGVFASSGEQTGNVLSSAGVTVVTTFDALTNTYTGVAGGVTVFTFAIDTTTGEYTYTQFEQFDHSDVNNNNEAIFLDFGIKAVDADGDTVNSSVRVNVLDDAPIVTSQVAVAVDETDFTGGPLTQSGQFFTNPGQDTPESYAGNNTFNAVGSVDNGVLTSNGVPVVVAFDAATNTYTGTANGATVFTLELDPQTGAYDYTQFLPLDHADTTDPDDVITLQFGADVIDFDGDSEPGTLLVQVRDDAPVTGDDTNTIDESDLSAGPIVINDSVSVNFGGDGQGTLGTSGTFTSGGSLDNGVLSSNGSPITVTSTPTGYVGVTATGVTAFTLDIDPTTGDYTFTQFANLDHADDNNVNDVISLNFGTVITDFDGDQEPGTIIVNIADDGPSFQPNGPQLDNGLETVDETDGPIVETGTLVADFGQDGPGTFVATGGFTPSGSLLNGELTHCGLPIEVTFDAQTNTYTGAAGGEVVFTLAVDAATGEYTYTQPGTFDHGDANDPDDILTLTFDVNAVDSEGEAVGGSIVINVRDDAPEAENIVADGVDETTAFAGGSQTIDGQIIADFGNDGASITAPAIAGNNNFSSGGSQTGGTLSSGGVPVTVSFDAATGTYTGIAAGVTVFTMAIEENGEYAFTLLGSLDHADGNAANDVINLNFGYGVTDKDGDTADAVITVNVADDVPQINNDSNQIDETNLDNGPLVVTDTLDFDFGQDGAGDVAPNGEFVVQDTAMNPIALTSDGRPVTVNQTADGYTGVANGVTIFTLVVDPTTGDYTYTQFAAVDHPDSTDPNDTIWLRFGVDVTDADGDSDSATILVDILDDGPDAVNDGDTAIEGQTINGNVTDNDDVGADVDGDVTQVVFNGVTTPVPTVGTTDVVGNFGTLTIAADGTYSYTANDNNPEGTDVFTYTLVDADGDTDTADLSIVVSPINDVPIIAPPPVTTVDDTDLENGPNIETGVINVDFGNDAPGEVNPNDMFSASVGNLTACNEPVTVTLSGNTYTGTAIINGIVTPIFTMEILENGEFTFTQLHAIDHPNTVNPNDVVTLNFGATATDADGDSVNTTLQVRVFDDGPQISQSVRQVDESDLANGNVVTTGTVPNDFGQDGPGAITTTGLFQAKFQRDGSAVQLESDGNPVTVTSTDGSYTGTANGETIFTITIDPATGEYVYTQFQNIDHPDANDPNDVIWLQFSVEITDKDGDTDSSVIVIDVADDAPDAVNDTASIDRAGTTATGNVLDNDDFGVDDGAAARLVTPGTFVGNFGTLVLAADGSFTYTRNGQAGGIDTFDYTITDSDGDTDTAQISINVAQDNNPTGIDGVGETDDTIVDNAGRDVETGSITVNFNGDGPGTTTGNGIFSAVNNANLDNGALTSNGVPVNVSFNASNNTYTGTAGGVTVFTMTINSNGTYRFTQNENLDHGNDNNNNEALTIRFGVTATDSDGDTGNGFVDIRVRDDAPDAVNDTASVGRTGRSASGNVRSNDDVGADDGPNAVVTTTGTFVGNFGFLTLNANGSYTYTRTNFTGGGTERFDYTLRDHEGDIDTAQLTIGVTANPPPPVSPPPGGRGGDGGDGGDGGGGDGAGDGGAGDGTPLVLDLDGDGIELLSQDEGVFFDIDLDGVADRTAWVDADDGLLALDVNGDGVINDRSELFGDTNGFEDGFQNLASYDSNNDGVIDAQDDVFDELLVWQDLNSDGISDANEQLTLEQIGIVSISLNTTVPDNLVIEGSDIILASTFTTQDGEVREIVDAVFQYESGAEATFGAEASNDADLFIFQAIQESAFEIDNFDTNEDTVDLSALIQGSDDVSDAISDFVYVTEQDGDTIISVDVDGTEGPAEAVEIAKLKGVSGATAEDLVDNGNIIV